MTSLTSTKNIFTSCICSARSKSATVKMPLNLSGLFLFFFVVALRQCNQVIQQCIELANLLRCEL